MDIVFETRAFARGAFTKAYKSIDGTQVKLISSCPMKEAMAFGWCGDSDLLPQIKQIDTQEYIMPYYDRIRALKRTLTPEHYAFYQELRALPWNQDTSIDSFFHWHKQFDTLTNETLREEIKEILDGMANYGTDIAFEISPRNIAVVNGKLILMDCFFSINALLNLRKGA